MSKYIIRIITDCGKSDENCFFVEYYKGLEESGGVLLTEDLAEAALFDNEEVCDNIIDHLYAVLDYIPRTIEKTKMFQVNPKL